METPPFAGNGYVLQPRINLRRSLPSFDVVDGLHGTLQARDDDCENSRDGNTCERPVGTDSTRLAIILGIVIPLTGAFLVLLFLHRRNMKRLKAEDADTNLDLDYGLGDAPQGKGGKRKSILGFGGEKQAHRPGQLSMDMNLSSPYLLPPGLHQSQDSLHSLVRTGFPGEHDPYRSISHFGGSDAGSIRSFNPSRDPPGYSSKRASVLTSRSAATSKLAPARTNSIPRPPTDVKTPYSPPKTTEPLPTLRSESPRIKETIVEAPRASPYPGSPRTDDELHMPTIQEPSPTLAKDFIGRHPSPAPPANPPTHLGPSDNGLKFDFTQPAGRMSPEEIPQRDPFNHPEQSFQPDIRTSVYSDDYPAFQEEQDRGRATERQQPSMEPQGLAVPAQNNKRLSVGFRPLPPTDVTDSEDPEYRANRIRSFYKEYFDDSKDAAPMPPPPQRGGANYYEDYDAGYMGDATYYDADSNAFVMPYAQPVTRRAMTPPPAGRMAMRGPPGPGPRGPHGPHGSIGGMSNQSGPRRPRAGSAFSGPRPGSSASARGPRQPPKKRGPPPAVLTTLPTPSKLKDDSFAILNAADFAPPETFRDQAAGRSQSPLGERRPYHSPQVPVSSPLVSPFDELGAMPSPHMLRKSLTFTNLEFAPPKKFKDSDTMSDAGSIRSNRSGISTVQLDAIRGGAGRVSRLPGDTVFTQASLSNQLKPQWGMRP
jgi:hypothetical protein